MPGSPVRRRLPPGPELVVVTDNLDLWRGRTDQRIYEHDRRLDAINGSIKEGSDAITALAIEMGKLTTRVGVYAAIGGVVAASVSSGLTAIIVFFLTR